MSNNNHATPDKPQSEPKLDLDGFERTKDPDTYKIRIKPLYPKHLYVATKEQPNK